MEDRFEATFVVSVDLVRDCRAVISQMPARTGTSLSIGTNVAPISFLSA